MTVYAGKGSVLQVDISSTLTTIAGVRNFTFDPGEVETMEIDDLSDTYVELDVTGRAGGGNITGSAFWDPANAQMQQLHTLWNTPARHDYSMTLSTTTESIAITNGILTKLTLNVERTDPITTDFEIKCGQRPAFNES